jgi:hypothetical protein
LDRGQPGDLKPERRGAQAATQCRRTCLHLRILLRRSSVLALPPPFARDVKLSPVESAPGPPQRPSMLKSGITNHPGTAGHLLDNFRKAPGDSTALHRRNLSYIAASMPSVSHVIVVIEREVPADGRPVSVLLEFTCADAQLLSRPPRSGEKSTNE